VKRATIIPLVIRRKARWNEDMARRFSILASQGKSHHEIAHALEVSVAAVEAHASRQNIGIRRTKAENEAMGRRFRELAASGLTIAKIAAALGMSYVAAQKYAYNHTIPVKNERENHPPTKWKETLEGPPAERSQEQNIVDVARTTLRHCGYTQKEIERMTLDQIMLAANKVRVRWKLPQLLGKPEWLVKER
jgi:hypothetical protein